jgi:purine-binding chemotaxis protein CheW
MKNRLQPIHTGAPSEKFHCVTFILGGDLFAIEIGYIREIIEFDGITRVPMMPDFVRGIINLRGSVVPVIDLSVRFGRGSTDIKPTTCVAILALPHAQVRYHEVGVLLDAVCEVMEIPQSDIEPTPTFGTSIRGDFIEGIATVSGKFAILLDVRKALSVSELSAMATAINLEQFVDDAQTV